MNTLRFPMTEAQQAIWLSQQQLDDPAVYGVAEMIRVRGPLNPDAWCQAADLVLASLPALRLRLDRGGDEFPHTVVGKPARCVLYNLREHEDPEAEVDAVIQQALQSPFDDCESLVSHAFLFHVGAEEFCWFLRVHHIALDGYGFAVVAQHISETYEALIGGQEPPIAATDHVASYRQALQDALSGASAEARDYWASQKPTEDTLPLAAARESYASVREPAGVYHETLSPAHLALATGLLAQAANRKDEVVIGVHMAARTTAALAQTACTVQNELPMHVKFAPDVSVAESLQNVQNQWRSMSAYQGYRKEHIRRDRAMAAHLPFADISLNIVPFNTELSFGQAVGKAEPLWDGPTDILTVDVRATAGRGHEVTLVAPRGSCQPQVLTAYAKVFERLYRDVLSQRRYTDSRALSSLSLTDRLPQVPAETTDEMHYLSRFLERFKGKTPVLYAPDRVLTGDQVQRYIVALARLLGAATTPQKRVLLLLERSIWAVIAPLAALYSGHTFIPCDTSWPKNRVRDLVEQVQPDIVLTLQNTVDKYGCQEFLSQVKTVITLDNYHVQQALANYTLQSTGELAEPRPDDIAYILFTSGTTGTPKGVMVRYRNLENYVRTLAEEYLPRVYAASGQQRPHRFVHEHSFAFDSSLSPLGFFMLGHALYLPDTNTLRDPRAHRDYLLGHCIDGIDISPVMLQELLRVGLECDQGKPGPSTIIIGGDACPESLWDYLHTRPHLNAINSYGPTENTVEATFAVIADYEQPTIGTSSPRQFALVTTSWGQACPVGFPGELWLGGASVSAGYLDLPEETAARFIETDAGSMYRSGDLVREEHDGRYTLLGRIDSQLSLNGVRIEGQEVELALCAQPEVAQAVVLVRDDGAGERLVGYVVVEPEYQNPAFSDELRHRLMDSLPVAHVPAVLVPLTSLPLTDRGKVDCSRLPAPGALGHTGRKGAELSVEEHLVAEIYAECTSVPLDHVSSETTLFSLGGNSLSAMRTVSQLHDLGYTGVNLTHLFADSSVASMGALCAENPPQLLGVAQEKTSLPSKSDEVLTSAQKRIWFIDRAEGASALYTVPLIFDIPAQDFDQERCEHALLDVLQSYPSLGSLYRIDQQGEVRLHRLDAADIRRRFRVHPVEYLTDAREQVNRLGVVIDVSQDLPLQAFVSSAGAAARLILIFHHIAVDGWALSAFTRIFARAYAQHATGSRLTEVLPLSATPQVANTTEEDLQWWKKYAQALPAVLDLPSDRPRPQERNHSGGEVRARMPVELASLLKQQAQNLGATPFMLLQGFTSMLLTRCGAGNDIALGTVIANRSTPQEEAAITFAANTVLTRVDTSGNPRFEELIQRIKMNTTQLLAHAHVPFDEVVNAVNPVRSTAYHPLFQVMVIEQNIEQEAWQITPGHSVTPYTVGTGTSKFDLTFEFSTVHTGSEAETREVRLEYATDIFDAETAQRILRWLLELVEVTLKKPDIKLWDRPLDQAGVHSAHREAQRMLTYRLQQHEQNTDELTGAAALADDRSLSEHLEKLLTQHADRRALIDVQPDGARKEVTYRQLDDQSRLVRDYLWSQGLGPGNRVALLVPRSSQQIAAVIGAVRAGVTYVPLDPEYPLSRLSIILQDAEVSAILHHRAPVLQELDSQLIDHCALVDLEKISPCHGGLEAPKITADTPAYIIFTSGSTGRPKGVVIPQRNVLRLLASTDHWFGASPVDTWALFHSYAFDFAVWEMFGALLTGGSLVLVPHDLSRSPQEFGQLLSRENVTILNQTPSAFSQLVILDEQTPLDLPSLRAVVLGGEAMDLPMVHRWQQNHPSTECQVINMYGITETTVHVTYQVVTETSSGTSPVGEPIPDLSVYLLDEGGHPVPDGITGEICVGGAGLAQGYWGREDLTAQKFVDDPFARAALATLPHNGLKITGAPKMYRSGDLAVRLPDGTLDFRGRADRQVQLRGFRIELGEVETAALSYPAAQDSFARVIGRSERDKRLLLYMVVPSTEQADSAAVRKYLAAILPAYMVPSSIIFMEKLPLTVNGKLDVDALPLPLLKTSGARPPVSELEGQLHSCFTQVLGIESCSVEDSFFDLGGHSMLAVELVAAIEKATGHSLRVGTVMRSPSIELLADALERDATGTKEDLQVLIPLQRSEGPSPYGAIYCLHPAGGLSWCYSSLTQHVPAAIPIWGLQARGVLEPGQQPGSLADMAEDYLNEIRRVHPGGPIHIIGWSLGGMVAQVLAHRALTAGLDLGVVALLDAYPSEAETGVGEPPLEDAVSAVLAMSGLEDEVLAGDFTLAALQGALKEHASPMAGLPAEIIEALTLTYRNTAKILREYAHPALAADVLFFQATRAGVGPDHDPHEWDRFIKGSLTVYPIDCTHREMTQALPISTIAARIVAKVTNNEAAPGR
ncbi:amino acid adenylation domain-containing protein [Rothia nasimurium]|uniref:amino acid adenylation domain-containing protein n=1 Tax=Rothia nasimurium TaxID=85336 RepID=UPI0009F1C6A5|nr:non-ribosomal peptide synthetase [Rothia nasimurium]